MEVESTFREETGNRETISTVFDYLLAQSGDKITDVADKIGVSSNTLYTIRSRRSERADIKLLKKLADYFGVDVAIFCGLREYEPPIKLADDEAELVKQFRGFSEFDKKRMLRVAARLKEGPEQIDFIEKFLSITDKAQSRFMESIEDALANPRNLRP